MDDRARCEVYTKILNSVGHSGELKEEISESTYNSQIKLIRADLVSEVLSNQEVAIQLLHILVDNNVHTIQHDFLDILSDVNIPQTLKNRLLEPVKNHLRDLLQKNNITQLSLLYSLLRSHDARKFAEIIKELYNDSASKLYPKNFLLNVLIPVILDTHNLTNPSKIICIDMALEFASIITIANLSASDCNTILAGVNDYINNMLELKEKNFDYWHKLWIFLVRFLGKKLHHSMNLMNRLLRVVEHAFRNPSFEQRLKGYDCWKELIDNASLDPQHICTEKQIKLLLTPLRAKFSRQEAVIIKRFEVFVYLIEKLQDKAVLVIKEFLEFSFGNVGDSSEPHKIGQGRSLPELWLRSARVLMAALGHSHDKNENCLETDTEVHLDPPILNGSNISGAYCHVIDSVAECCKMLKEVELGQRKNTVLKCFWRSLLQIILKDDVQKQNNCIERIGKVLDTFLKDNDPYCHVVATIIFKETVEIEESGSHQLILVNLERYLNVVFSAPLSKESYIDVEKFLSVLRNFASSEGSSTVLTRIFDCFRKHKSVENNADFVADIWIFLASELEDYAKGGALEFLVWPLLHAHELKEHVKQISVYEHYQRLVCPFVERSDELHLALFKYFEKTLKNHPLLLKNVLSLVVLFNPKTTHKDITNVTLDILAFMLLIPATGDSTNQRDTIQQYLRKLYEANISNIHDQDTIKKLCTCVEHLLKLKHYDILTSVEDPLTNLPDNVKWIYAKFLTLDFLVDIFEKETDLKVTEKVHRIIESLRNVKNPEQKKDITGIMPLGGRSAKIANLVKQIPLSPEKAVTSPSTLRLFGKDVETHSPLKVVGSQLKGVKSTPKKRPTSVTPTKKKKPAAFIDDESNSKFVLIESEVKLDKGKLTEHQKETLKKRREDIPALYQDLSQSASQSFDSSSCNAIKPIEAEVFKKPTEFNFSEHKAEKDSKEVPDALEMDEPKNMDYEESLTIENTTKANAKDKLSKLKMDVELKKLSMDIVGAEDFVSAGSKRKRRELKPDKKSERAGKRKRTSVDVKKEHTTTVKNNDLSEKGSAKKRDGVSGRAEDNEDNNVKTTKASGSLESPISSTSTGDTVESKSLNKKEAVAKLENETLLQNVMETESDIFKSAQTQIEVPAESSESVADKNKKSGVINDREISDMKAKDVESPTESADEQTPQKRKRKNRKSLGPPTSISKIRKSIRRSLPTKKLTQSDIFKSTKLKNFTIDKYHKNTEDAEGSLDINTPSENKTQSELFDNHPEESLGESAVVEPIENKPTSKKEKSEAVKVAAENKAKKYRQLSIEDSPKTSRSAAKKQTPVAGACENGFIKTNKRKRVSSSEDDDDIIESSQESNVSSISASKLRLSLSKRSTPKAAQANNNTSATIELEKKIKTPKQPQVNNTSGIDAGSTDLKLTKEKLTDPVDAPIIGTVVNGRLSGESASSCDTPTNSITLERGGPPITDSVKRKRGRPRKNQQTPSLIPVEVAPEGSKSKADDDSQILLSTETNSTIVSIAEANSIESNDPKHISDNINPLNDAKKKSKRKRNLEDSLGSDKNSDTSADTSLESTLKETKKGKRKSARKRDEAQIAASESKQPDVSTANNIENAAQDDEKTTQSQETQTQGTEPLLIDSGEGQLQLDLPQQAPLTESEQEVARMDTVSLPLMDDVDILPSNELDDNKTVVEDKTVIETAPLSEEVKEEVVIESACEQTEDIFTYQDCNTTNAEENGKEEDNGKEEENGKDDVESLTDFLGFDTRQRDTMVPDRSFETEVTATEALVRQLIDRDIEVITEPDLSPIKTPATASHVGTPGSFEASIPSSPITGETPNRTSELLNNTSDISPIGSKSGSDNSSSDDEFVEVRKFAPVALKFDSDNAEVDTQKQKSPEKGDDAPQKMDETSPEMAEKQVEIIAIESPPKDEDASSGKITVNSAEKSGRFSWTKQGLPTSHRFFNRRKIGHAMSPSASRIKKLMSNVKPPSQGEHTDEINQEDVLTFTREVPSPLAVPRSSILKRKLSDPHDDGLSPCAKRKRVNFSDPCTTSRKVFLKEDTGPSQCLFGNFTSEDLDKQFLEVLAANNTVESPQTESDNIETEPSLQLNNPMLLRDDVPIYPELVDCLDNVSVISRKLTGPMFVNALLSKLNGKNIRTIGDLARQSEVNIARLPFKTPMLATVHRALDNYYHKNFKCKGTADKVEIVPVNGPEPEPKTEFRTMEVIVEPIDVRLELSKIMDKARCQNISTETICSLVFESCDQSSILTWIKTHFKLEPRDMVDEKDFPTLIKHITESIGIPKIFEVLTESLESTEDQSIYLDCMVKHSVDKRSLAKLIEKRSLEELQTAIWENVENEKYSKKDLLDTCFLPYVYSIDLSSFFNRLTVVEVTDIILNRLKTEDYKAFMKRIAERCSNREEVRDELLQNYSISELSSNIIKRGTTKEVVFLARHLLLTAAKEDKKALVDVFETVSDCMIAELPPSKLMELSVEFLKKIPIRD